MDWSYWQRDPNELLTPRPGVNAFPVNWQGNERIGFTFTTITDAFDTYCTGDKWCFIACHSAGCAQVGYALDHYGTTGEIPTWNIFWVAAAGSAAGGSEVSDFKQWSIAVPLDEDLKTAVMRNLYDHNNTAGVVHMMFAGAGDSDSSLYNALDAFLPDNNDRAVAYHSSCGVSNDFYTLQNTWCNPGEACTGNYVEEGPQSYLWNMHTIWFLDRSKEYAHFIDDADNGICHELFDFMDQNAQ